LKQQLSEESSGFMKSEKTVTQRTLVMVHVK